MIEKLQASVICFYALLAYVSMETKKNLNSAGIKAKSYTRLPQITNILHVPQK